MNALSNGLLRRFQIQVYRWYLYAVSSTLTSVIGSFLLFYFLGLDYLGLVSLSICRLFCGVVILLQFKLNQPNQFSRMNISHPETKFAIFLAILSGIIVFIADLFIYMSARLSQQQQQGNSSNFASMFLFAGVFIAVIAARKLFMETMTYSEIAGVMVLFVAAVGMGVCDCLTSGVAESAVLGYLLSTALLASRTLMVKQVSRLRMAVSVAAMFNLIASGLCGGVLVGYLNAVDSLKYHEMSFKELSFMVLGSFLLTLSQVLELTGLMKGKVGPVMAVMRAEPLILQFFYYIDGLARASPPEVAFMIINIIGMAIGGLHIKHLQVRHESLEDDRAFLFEVESSNSSYLSERAVF